MSTSVDANRQLLEQALAALDRLSDAQYADRRGAWAPVGAQYRHVLDHYHCFLEGLPTREIDYDQRARDPRLESSRDAAAAATRAVRDAIAVIDAEADYPVRVQLRTSADAADPEWTSSTVGRELQFLLSHTVHHFALMKLLVAGDQVDLGAEFGVAPSTLSYARAQR
ncbi:MAG: DinB family protein [Gemmatimonadales bacterium]